MNLDCLPQRLRGALGLIRPASQGQSHGWSKQNDSIMQRKKQRPQEDHLGVKGILQGSETGLEHYFGNAKLIGKAFLLLEIFIIVPLHSYKYGKCNLILEESRR